MFFYVMPIWNDSMGYRLLKMSGFLIDEVLSIRKPTLLLSKCQKEIHYRQFRNTLISHWHKFNACPLDTNG